MVHPILVFKKSEHPNHFLKFPLGINLFAVELKTKVFVLFSFFRKPTFSNVYISAELLCQVYQFVLPFWSTICLNTGTPHHACKLKILVQPVEKHRARPLNDDIYLRDKI